MKLKIYQVDAFTEKLFGGNPAAVVPLKEWLPEATMQQIAAENNLAETAFFIPKGDGDYHLRWFTPENEVNLCGHATVASGYVLFNHENFSGDLITFESKSGLLTVKKSGNLFTLNFPVYKIIQQKHPMM
jgi:PhzF family phenazine biosynthesis protein